MERCDFASVMAVIKTYISESQEMNQIDFLYLLFDDYISSDAGADYDFDNGLVCRWMNGNAKVSPRISKYYLDETHRQALAANILRNLLPVMSDSAMAVQKIYELIIGDTSVSERKKQELTRAYPCRNKQEDADFIASAVCFGMNRDFLRRDIRTKALLSSGNLSPVLADYIFSSDVPRPCRYFCGREKELEQLHLLLTEQGKIFLQGIAGIGKSELAKAYAKKYRKEYTNILYIIYSGDLRQDVIELDFADDLPDDSDEERFRKHNRFLRALKSDTLLIVDNFNVTAAKDSFLPVLLKYRCRILFTTRSRMEHYPAMQLSEISDKMALLDLMGHYYSGAQTHGDELSQIIDTVHSHTLAVELAARLLEHGILRPSALLEKLQTEKAALDDADKISITKDGIPARETYYGHIHTLFSLYLLSEEQQKIMRNMALIPVTGIPVRRLTDWFSLTDLNAVNDLIELGFVTPQPGRSVSLHPMIQEIAQADLKPSVSGCRIFLQNLQNICLLHGVDVPYYKVMFQTIENIISICGNVTRAQGAPASSSPLSENRCAMSGDCGKDDTAFYMRFLEDVFPYMEKYHYEQGMQLILREMQELLKNPSIGSANDRALFLNYRSSFEKNAEKAIQLEKDALALLPKVSADNALLVSNLHANLGGRYREAGQYDLARRHMETGIRILEQYHLSYMNDSVAQITNYAVFLCDTGEPDRGMYALRRLSRVIKEYSSEQSGDYAEVQEAMGGICLAQGKISDASTHFGRAMKIYGTLWAESPELVEAKYQEITELYPQAKTILAKESPDNHEII